MLFVHLIYVLANYIGVLVLLAEKCRFFFFFFPVCRLLSKQKKTDPCSILRCWKLGVTSTKPTELQGLRPSSCSGADVCWVVSNCPVSGDGDGDGLLIRWRATPHSSFMSRCRMTMSTDGSDFRYRGCTPSAGCTHVACPFRQVNTVLFADAYAKLTFTPI